MKTVRIIKNWSQPNIFRQTPGGTGRWEDVIFTEEAVDSCDYVIVLNYPNTSLQVTCPPQQLWCLLQEPPNELFSDWHRPPAVYARVFSTDDSVSGARYVNDQPALPWLINRTYDELISLRCPEKTKLVSWITSHKAFSQGHKKRMRFLKTIRGSPAIDIIATNEYYPQTRPDGFTSLVSGKWEGLAPYRYSLAVENYQGSDYWSEKLADCFLCYTLPLYYGCTNISRYFPSASYVAIHIDDPEVGKQIQSVIHSPLWETRRTAIEEARRLILQDYQFFPAMVKHIRAWEKTHSGETMSDITIPKGPYIRWQSLFHRMVRRLTLRS